MVHSITAENALALGRPDLERGERHLAEMGGRCEEIWGDVGRCGEPGGEGGVHLR